MVNTVDDALDEKKVRREAQMWVYEFLKKYNIKHPSIAFKRQLLHEAVMERYTKRNSSGNLLIQKYEASKKLKEKDNESEISDQ